MIQSIEKNLRLMGELYEFDHSDSDSLNRLIAENMPSKHGENELDENALELITAAVQEPIVRKTPQEK